MEFPIDQVIAGCGQLGLSIQIDMDMERRLRDYAALLIQWNQKMNLTAITDPSQIARKHFVDSAALLKFVSLPKGARVIDVGTGAGFPGLVLKVLRPDIRLTLLDSLQKRLRFLEAACEKLELEADMVHGRAEDCGRDSFYRQQFDLATARAVARLPVLMEYCMPFVSLGGIFAAMKGPEGTVEAEEAKAACRILGGEEIQVHGYILPGGDQRSIALAKKIAQTPTKYPRNAAQIAKRAL